MADKSDITPMEEDRVYFLFKRGRQEHIQALFEEGEVFISPIDFIRTCDGNKERSDEDDGLRERAYLGDLKVTMYDADGDVDKDGITLNAINGIIKADNQEKGNIYCLTGVFSQHLTGETPARFDTKSLGDTTILIHNPKKFLERPFKALNDLGYPAAQAGRVDYYKNDYSGKVGFFKKHENYASQSEFRIFVPNTKNKPIKLRIGSLKDIASFNTGFIKLTYNDGTEEIIEL